MCIHSTESTAKSTNLSSRSVRNSLYWMLWAVFFLAAPALRGQTTGEWQARSSAGTAVWSEPSLDVSQFTGNIGAATASCVSALPATGGVCDARALTGAQTISAQLVLSGKPIMWLLSPSVVISCTATTSPCIAFGNQVGINCELNTALANTMGCTIETSTAAETLIGPNTPTANTKDLHIRGVTLWNSSTSASAAVVDLTNTSFSTIENSGIGHDGGTGDGLFVKVTSSTLAAFHDSLMNSYVFMNGSGNAIHVTNGGNEFNVFGGELQSSSCGINVDNTTSNPGGTDGVHLYGTSAEAYSDAALCIEPTMGTVYGVVWSGGRFESTTGSVIDITPSGGATVSQVYMIGPNIDSGQNPPVDAGHATTWLYSGGSASAGGYNLPDALTTSHTIGVGGLNQISANGNLAGRVSLSGGTATVTFSPSFNSAPVCTATDTSGGHVVQASTTASGLSLTGTGTDVVAYICAGNPN